MDQDYNVKEDWNGKFLFKLQQEFGARVERGFFSNSEDLCIAQEELDVEPGRCHAVHFFLLLAQKFAATQKSISKLQYLFSEVSELRNTVQNFP